MSTYYARNRDEILARLAAKKEQRTEYNKAYYIKNKEKLDAKCNDRFQANRDKKIECPCGAYVTIDYYKQHLKSDKHRDAISCGTHCDCGQLIWYDCLYKLKRHQARPTHQAWLNAAESSYIDYIPDTECSECEDVEEEQEIVLVLPDLVLTDSEIETPEDIINKFEEERLKTNAAALKYYHDNKNNVNSSICKRREEGKRSEAHKETVKAYAKTEKAKQMRYERDHRIVSCECSWKGLNAAKSRHKSQNQHIKYLEIQQFKQQ